jgi:hypothetical protein
MLVALSILFVGLFGFLSVSIGKFTGRIAYYTSQLDIRTDELQSLLQSLGAVSVMDGEVGSVPFLTFSLVVLVG